MFVCMFRISLCLTPEIAKFYVFRASAYILAQKKKVIRQELEIQAYDTLRRRCNELADRLGAVSSQRECPEDVTEAVCTIIWAAGKAEVSAVRAHTLVSPDLWFLAPKDRCSRYRNHGSGGSAILPRLESSTYVVPSQATRLSADADVLSCHPFLPFVFTCAPPEELEYGISKGTHFPV